MKTPRDYQINARDAVFNEFARGIKSTLVVMPTGLGKTVLFSKVATEWTEGGVLVLAHRIELLDQAADKLECELCYRPPIEQGMRGVDLEWDDGRVVVGSIQSMRNRVIKYASRPFGLIIVDEAHHATAASYQYIIDECRKINPNCCVMGVTATPNRSDKTALGLAFESVAYQMELRDAIELGWLVDIRQEYVMIEACDLDLSEVGTTTNEMGEKDFDRVKMEKQFIQEKALLAMAQPILDKTIRGEQAVIFTSGVKHAHMLADVLSDMKHGSAAAVDGTTPKQDRENIVKQFHKGALQYLCNFGVFTEGFDAPATSMIVMGRPTKSVSLYTQMLGRGTRPLPGVVDGVDSVDARRDAILASNKPHMTVLDFVGNSKHKPVSAIDVLGGNYDVDIRQLAEKNVVEEGGDVLEELRKAKAEKALIAEEYRRRAMALQKKREEEARRRREKIKATVDYRTAHVPVFGSKASPVAQHVDRQGGATQKQINYLGYLGVPYETASKYSKGQAGAVISKIKKERGIK